MLGNTKFEQSRPLTSRVNVGDHDFFDGKFQDHVVSLVVADTPQMPEPIFEIPQEQRARPRVSRPLTRQTTSGVDEHGAKILEVLRDELSDSTSRIKSYEGVDDQGRRSYYMLTNGGPRVCPHGKKNFYNNNFRVLLSREGIVTYCCCFTKDICGGCFTDIGKIERPPSLHVLSDNVYDAEVIDEKPRCRMIEFGDKTSIVLREEMGTGKTHQVIVYILHSVHSKKT